MFVQAVETTHLLADGSPPGDSPWIWLLFIAGAAVVVLLLRRQAKRGKAADVPSRATDAASDLHRSMDRLLVELQEASREINATIDTKMIVLNKLIRDADRKIAELKALQQAPAGEKGSDPIEPLTPEARRRREVEREICRLADEGKTELEIARETGTPRGEVELVLRLRPRPGTGDTPR